MSYYKMERGWLDSAVWEDEPYSRREAWAWLIAEAAWDDNKTVALNHRPVRLKRGQLLASNSLGSAGARLQVRGGRPSVVDGPFAEAKEMIGGYFLR